MTSLHEISTTSILASSGLFYKGANIAEKKVKKNLSTATSNNLISVVSQISPDNNNKENLPTFVSSTSSLDICSPLDAICAGARCFDDEPPQPHRIENNSCSELVELTIKIKETEVLHNDNADLEDLRSTIEVLETQLAGVTDQRERKEQCLFKLAQEFSRRSEVLEYTRNQLSQMTETVQILQSRQAFSRSIAETTELKKTVKKLREELKAAKRAKTQSPSWMVALFGVVVAMVVKAPKKAWNAAGVPRLKSQKKSRK